MALVSEVAKRLNEQYPPDAHIAVAIWCEEDVIGRAQARGKEITREQAQRILDTIERRQDCEIGISWVTLDVYTDEELES